MITRRHAVAVEFQFVPRSAVARGGGNAEYEALHSERVRCGVWE